MARYRGTVKGQRGEASRLGSEKTGIDVRANGWDTGVRVLLSVRGGRDVALIYATGGSNGKGAERLLGVLDARGWLPADAAPAPVALGREYDEDEGPGCDEGRERFGG